ncbi:MAG: CbiX/SirB N-terminal domain-containing protein [Metallosphaera sp.]|uniref:Sirohydrochlorin cobaltochelatase n=1 Tax=Metallosphaera cuprina (strain Ar-4) TaxID=1006006 RepID=F4FXX6_METCR|nr:CbiX/SirB N-terminal domain-containing protein [Metallosphaera cuprina]AEB94174.1 sirohydrochlorin cobaltochelatase [Metallosphaera cuprina Ar-4]
MKLGILLVLHGSRVNEWRDVAVNYRDLLKNYFDLVQFGFIEFNEPTLRQATESLIRLGATKIVAVPLLFAAGAHFYRDIPRLIGVNENGKVNIDNKIVDVIIARPIGIDKRVAEILKERVEQAIDGLRQV